ncbi:class C sortase [Lacticaseibacillus daqingensis]|uniref:class C sortase n=1 Tax=Lacticaseibacillus daqingensis TaxID=2486014 RepID=UPI000F791862|nr:class C sortase [Lacticaseibacillus daqingensis]
MAKGKRKKAKLSTDLIVLLVFFAGLATFAYPFVAQAVNTVTVALRVQRDTKMAQENARKQAADMKANNERLAKYGMRPNSDIFEQKGTGIQSVKALREHMIGVITIPKLNVNLPLFDTVGEDLLQNGAVVLPGTSAPTGGASTHTVISAHSGLPSKTLFTNLYKLKKGQQFIITVNDKRLAYKVNKIETIEPTDTKALTIVPGKDLATLMTCTPIGINSHRLLVTGYRVPYTEATAKAVSVGTQRAWWQSLGVIAGAVLGLALLITLIVRLVRKHRRPH